MVLSIPLVIFKAAFWHYEIQERRIIISYRDKKPTETRIVGGKENVVNFCYSDVTPRSCTINSRPHFQLPSSSIGFSLNFCKAKTKKAFRFWYSSNYKAVSLLAFKRREVPLKPLKKEDEKEAMTIKPAVRISDRRLIVRNRTILSGVPDNVIATSGSTSGPVEGVFLGAVFDQENSRHVTSLGALRDARFMACFRFKLWWMAQKMGDQGRDIPLETQFLLVETKDGSHLESDGGDEDNRVVYTVFLPLIEGSFRACLQGNGSDELELCLESGDAETTTSSFTHTLFVHAGTDPFRTITEAVRAVKLHLKTFRQRHEKKLPGIIDHFGWCTWDAFYQEVTQEGVEAGLQSLVSGGTPPKFVIIDDGWQSVGGDPQEETNGQDVNKQDQQPLPRLTGIKENAKFQKKDDPAAGIKSIVNIAKEKHGLKYVYVWHAITGYWGGVRPGVEEMEGYGSTMKYPMVSKGVAENEPAWKNDALTLQGLGLVNPKKVFKFYNELHSYLAAAGIDGVKVDVQCILETLGAGLGGRVELTRQYHQALDASVARNFRDNGCIACMSHNTDSLYCSKQTAVVRASDDFYPRDPVSHTIHIAAFMQPDWDMFHSLHPAAEYHASARAISGGPIYASDAPGKHNFELLKKLVLPDGSTLRARLPGRPTSDCLFSDPARDGVSLLKIWNMNKFTGVLGVYNCQGAAWNSTEKKNTFHETKTEALQAPLGAVMFTSSLKLPRTPTGMAAVLSIVLAPGFSFAPLGLINMFNAGGAIDGLKYEVKGGAGLSELDDGYRGESSCVAEERVGNYSDELVGKVCMEVKGCGKFGAYSSAKPRKCIVDSNVVDFVYDSNSGLVGFSLDSLPEEGKLHLVEIEL
ncbi:galactinol--sucrose galactosyltransferase [Salix suchowensis]|nr:galactinol--sucrose galactosyltransferase [Salix suchowensis]